MTDWMVFNEAADDDAEIDEVRRRLAESKTALERLQLSAERLRSIVPPPTPPPIPDPPDELAELRDELDTARGQLDVVREQHDAAEVRAEWSAWQLRRFRARKSTRMLTAVRRPRSLADAGAVARNVFAELRRPSILEPPPAVEPTVDRRGDSRDDVERDAESYDEPSSAVSAPGDDHGADGDIGRADGAVYPVPWVPVLPTVRSAPPPNATVVLSVTSATSDGASTSHALRAEACFGIQRAVGLHPVALVVGDRAAARRASDVERHVVSLSDDYPTAGVPVHAEINDLAVTAWQQMDQIRPGRIHAFMHAGVPCTRIAIALAQRLQVPITLDLRGQTTGGTLDSSVVDSIRTARHHLDDVRLVIDHESVRGLVADHVEAELDDDDVVVIPDLVDPTWLEDATLEGGSTSNRHTVIGCFTEVGPRTVEAAGTAVQIVTERGFDVELVMVPESPVAVTPDVTQPAVAPIGTELIRLVEHMDLAVVPTADTTTSPLAQILALCGTDSVCAPDDSDVAGSTEAARAAAASVEVARRIESRLAERRARRMTDADADAGANHRAAIAASWRAAVDAYSQLVREDAS